KLDSGGQEVGSIVLDAVGQPRAYGQGILFGPGGRLFVPISTLGSPDTGAIRSYDVSDGSFVNFAAPGTLGSAWYLTFGNTDPAPLASAGPRGAAAALPASAAAGLAAGTPAPGGPEVTSGHAAADPGLDVLRAPALNGQQTLMAMSDPAPAPGEV